LFRAIVRVYLRQSSKRKPWRLKGADDLEVVADEDVVRPIDADIVNAAPVALFASVPLTIVPEP
jgi:hypothetical protein